jgi:hypothetical protein
VPPLIAAPRRGPVSGTLGAVLKSVAILALALSGTVAQGQSPDKQQESAAEARRRQMFINLRAQSVRPQRREDPLRQDNISDEEVREIQSIASGLIPKSIINIGSVVLGCPCEDGPDCTEQVWIVGYAAGVAKGVMLSRIKNRWTVGTIQQWWLGLEQLNARRATSKSSFAFWRAQQQYQDSFPACPSEIDEYIRRPLPDTKK